MKKIVTLLLILVFFINVNAQEWEEIYSNDKIKIETTITECNPNNKQYPFSYLLVKYTNKTNKAIQFDFEFELWYNDILQKEEKNDSADEDIIKTISLTANETKEGDCNASSKIFKLFYKNNHPKMNNLLTDIKIKAFKTK